jgi:hypothetical protein
MAQQTLLSLSRQKRLYNAILHLDPIAYLPLNENDGSVALNHAPKNRYALTGATSGATIGQPGIAGKSYSFDGVNDFVEVPDSGGILNFTGSRTVIMLVKLRSKGANRVFFSSDGAGAAFFSLMRLQFNTGGTTFIVTIKSGGNDFSLNSNFSPALDTWYLLATVYDAATTKLYIYVNGVEKNSTTVTLEEVTLVKTRIGTYGGSAVYGDFYGQHVAWINAAVPASKILRLARIAGLA